MEIVVVCYIYIYILVLVLGVKSFHFNECILFHFVIRCIQCFAFTKCGNKKNIIALLPTHTHKYTKKKLQRDNSNRAHDSKICAKNRERRYFFFFFFFDEIAQFDIRCVFTCPSRIKFLGPLFVCLRVFFYLIICIMCLNIFFFGLELRIEFYVYLFV